MRASEILTEEELASIELREDMTSETRRLVASVRELTSRLALCHEYGIEYIKETDPMLSCEDDDGILKCGTCRACLQQRIDRMEHAQYIAKMHEQKP